MSLPKISQPIFSLTLPSSGKKIRYRQFTVKEEKILLTAQASGEKADMVEAFKQLINNCALDPIDPDKMPAYDVEYFFLQLRAKSVGNVIKLSFEEAGVAHEVEIKLDEVQVSKPSVSNRIILDEADGVGVVLRYPTFAMVEEIASMEPDQASSMKLFSMIIESIFDKESVYPTAEADKAELEAWILDLNNQQVALIQKFLEEMPYVYLDVEYKVGDETRTTRIRGIESFFE